MGQSNYSAANPYLDAIVRYRRTLGLNASSMNCGMIIGVGLVAENESLMQWLTKMGSDTVNENELLYQIEEAVIGGSGPVLSTPGVIQLLYHWCELKAKGCLLARKIIVPQLLLESRP